MRTVQTLALQNKLALSNLPTRSYFPDNPSILSRLIQLKNAVKSGEVTQKDAIRSELISSMQMAEKLGIYYDYCDHTHYADQNGVYGATVGQHGFGVHSSCADTPLIIRTFLSMLCMIILKLQANTFKSPVANGLKMPM